MDRRDYEGLNELSKFLTIQRLLKILKPLSLQLQIWKLIPKEPRLKLRPIWSHPDGSPNGILGLSPVPQMVEQVKQWSD
jgi:hypothetical protein